MRVTKYIFLALISTLVALTSLAQDTNAVQKPNMGYIDYSFPRTYEISGIMISGTNYYDKSVLQVLSGLEIGQKIKIPGDDITRAITNLWKQKLFDDVKIGILDITDDKVSLEITLREKPRLSNFTIRGLRKGKATSLRDELTIKSGQIITENMLNSTRIQIKKYFIDKGYLDADATFEVIPDDARKNTSKLRITVNRGEKVKINSINFIGNTTVPSKKLKKSLKKTKERKRFLAKSRYIENEYEEDKNKIIEKYLSLGYRDIEIISDSVYRNEERRNGGREAEEIENTIRNCLENKREKKNLKKRQ